MAQEIFLVRTENGLRAYDAASDEIISKLPFKKPFRAKFTLARNVKHHRKFFALLQVVYENQERYPTLDHLLTAIKIGIGHYDEWKQGETPIRVPKSIAFDAMDQKAFEELYNRVVELICAQILPGCNQEDLIRQVEEILGDHQVSQ